MGNSWTSVFPNTGAWEQQEWNNTMRQTKTVRREAWGWKKSKAGAKERSRQPITTKSKYNINEHKMLLFYKIWKKNSEIQLIKNKMDLSNRKITNHPPSPGFQQNYSAPSRVPHWGYLEQFETRLYSLWSNSGCQLCLYVASQYQFFRTLFKWHI